MHILEPWRRPEAIFFLTRPQTATGLSARTKPRKRGLVAGRAPCGDDLEALEIRVSIPASSDSTYQ